MGPARVYQLAEVYDKIRVFSAYREAIPATGDMGVQIPDTPALTIDEMDEVSYCLRQYLIEQQGVIVGRKLEELNSERVRLESLLIDDCFLKESITQSVQFSALMRQRDEELVRKAQHDTKWFPYPFRDLRAGQNAPPAEKG